MEIKFWLHRFQSVDKKKLKSIIKVVNKAINRKVKECSHEVIKKMMQRIFKTVEECVEKVVKDICLRNGLNEEEEMSKVRELLSMEAKVSKVKKVSSVSSSVSSSVVKEEENSVLKIGRKKVQIPFNGEIREMNCRAIQKNGGLYTQCVMVKKEGRDYCAGCEKLMEDKGLESPELGRIEERMECGVMEYVGKDGEKPKAYMEILKKQKVTKEEVLEEARKRNISILEIHFEEKVENKVKVVKEKGQKGRPKKEKPVMEIEGDDIFASLVAEANELEEEVVVEKVEKVEKISLKAEKDAEKEAEKEAKKAEKEAKLAAAKAEKEAKLAAAKAEKEAKQAALKAEKEAKQAAAKAEKEAKKSSGSPTKKAKKEVEDEEEEKVKKIEYEGKKYLKSLKTGVIYDYEKYKNEGDPVVVGMWIESENKIKFEDAEESEEEYDE